MAACSRISHLGCQPWASGRAGQLQIHPRVGRCAHLTTCHCVSRRFPSSWGFWGAASWPAWSAIEVACHSPYCSSVYYSSAHSGERKGSFKNFSPGWQSHPSSSGNHLALCKLISLLHILLWPDTSQESGLCYDGLPACSGVQIAQGLLSHAVAAQGQVEGVRSQNLHWIHCPASSRADGASRIETEKCKLRE